jgi:hypothetical protein
VQPNLEQVRISLIQTGSPDAQLLQNGRKAYLQLPATAGRILLNGKPLRYEPSVHAYPLQGKLEQEFVRIETPSDTLFYQLDLENRWNYRPPHSEQLRLKYKQLKFRCKARKARKTHLHGYLALNQPRYRPGDTLQLKAYVTDWRGRPYRDSLQVYIRDKRSNKRIFYCNEKPDQSGIIQHPHHHTRRGAATLLILLETQSFLREQQWRTARKTAQLRYVLPGGIGEPNTRGS